MRYLWKRCIFVLCAMLILLTITACQKAEKISVEEERVETAELEDELEVTEDELEVTEDEAEIVTVLDWQMQYDLGMKYLSEGNYEEAVIAFTAAIELEPKNVPAYIGLSDVYLATEDYDNALATLDMAYDLGESDEVIRRYRIVVAHDLEELCQAENFEELAVYLESERYLKAFGELTAGDEPIILETEGMDFGIYPVESDKYGDRMFYYGNIENGLRTGEALWLGYQLVGGTIDKNYALWLADAEELWGLEGFALQP